MALKLKTIKEDIGKMPAIPTELEFDSSRIGSIAEGWYAVRINSKGIEVLPPYANCFGTGPDAFEKCLQACNVHNEFIGMKPKEIGILYAQRRFSHATSAS
jgi:hypothetical protein